MMRPFMSSLGRGTTRNDHLRDLIAGDTLNRQGDQFTGLNFGRFLGAIFNFTHLPGEVLLRFFFDLLQQQIACFVRGHSGNFFQARALVPASIVLHLVTAPVQAALALVELLLALFQALRLLVQFVGLFFQPFFGASKVLKTTFSGLFGLLPDFLRPPGAWSVRYCSTSLSTAARLLIQFLLQLAVELLRIGVS